MTEITRQNEIVCAATFIKADGSAGNPTNAEAKVYYTDLAGGTGIETITLTQDADGVWRGIWDSSPAGAGPVEWTARCWGGFKGADQGTFYIKANRANT